MYVQIRVKFRTSYIQYPGPSFKPMPKSNLSPFRSGKPREWNHLEPIHMSSLVVPRCGLIQSTQGQPDLAN